MKGSEALSPFAAKPAHPFPGRFHSGRESRSGGDDWRAIQADQPARQAGLPTGMAQVKAPVVLNRKVARDHFLMRLKSPLVALRALPGQFVHVLCDPVGFGTGIRRAQPSPLPLLRRPFSLLDADAESGTIDFVYKVVGLGTEHLAQIPKGAYVDLLGPLGRPFEVPDDLKTAYLVGGGVGIPPLYLLAKWLIRKKSKAVVFLGARTRDWVICIAQFQRIGIPVRIATDDGTLGFKGSVVDLLGKFLCTRNGYPKAGSRLGAKGSKAAVYVCGPTPMMAAASRLARRWELPAQVSLEERMGCAMGCCMGCVVEMATEPLDSHRRFQRVCTEGPVFDAEAILWR